MANNRTEEEFLAHTAGKIFVKKCEEAGLDLSKWIFGECSIDDDPYEYWAWHAPFRNCTIYYITDTDEDVTISAELDDHTGTWEAHDFGLNRD